MKIKDLIIKLQKFDQELEVVRGDDPNYSCYIAGISEPEEGYIHGKYNHIFSHFIKYKDDGTPENQQKVVKI